MTRQAKHLDSGELDFGPLPPWPVDAGWYGRHRYSDDSPSRLGILPNAVLQLCRQAPRMSSTALALCRDAVASLNHRLATIAAQQTCTGAGD
jgi:hypothetical protein